MYISIKLVLIGLAILLTLCTFLFISVVYIKLMQARREKERIADTKKIKPVLHKLITAENVKFFKNNGHSVMKLTEKLHAKSSMQTLEDILLENLEDSDNRTKARVRTVAYQFGFPEKCLSMIRDRLTGNISIGCRKAGLYQFEDAIPDLLKTLDILSSDTQYQALMALARIGDSTAMLQAFNKIHRLVFVNERTINEMLNTFSGDRHKLFSEMIYHQSDYLARLSMKAIDGETANTLIKDIISIYQNGDKETRLACITAIGKTGMSGKNTLLIRAMSDKEWELRAMSAKMLGILKDPSALKPLAKAARDREWWVRQNAVNSILAYPNSGEILLSIAKTGDSYAYDSILYALDKANQTELLSKIKKIDTQKGKPRDKIPAL